MNDCWTCTVVGTYADQAVNYVGALSNAMAPAATVLFTSIFSLWIVIRGIQISLGTFNIAELVKEGIFVVAAFTLLQGLGDGMVRFIYATSMTIMTGAARMVIIGSVDNVQVPESLSAYKSLIALMASVENGIDKVLAIGDNMEIKGGIFDFISKSFSQFVFSLLLVIFYFLILIQFLAQVVVTIFRVLIIAAFAPFLCLAFGFGWGRGMALAGVRTLLAAGMVLFAATAVIGLVMSGVDSLMADTALQEKMVPYPADCTVDAGVDGTFPERSCTGIDYQLELQQGNIFNDPAFLMILLLGIMGSVLLREATGLANSIANASLSNAAAGGMVAGAGVAKGAAAFLPKMAATKAGGAILSFGGDKISNMGRQIVADRIKRAQQPDRS